MRMRQEQVVLLASVLLLGFMSWSLIKEAPTRKSSRRGSTLEMEHFAPPDIARAIPMEEVTPGLRRELFAPPRDTRPLPPLEMVEPPRLPLAGLLPPPSPGPSPAAFGTVLRRSAEVTDVPDLFAEAEAEGGFEDTSFEESAAEGDDGRRIRDLLAEAAADGNAFEDETPAERETRYAGYRSRYDWIQRAAGESEFGRIVNEERFGLKTDSSRANEAILFVRLDPETGREWFKNVGAPPIPYERDQMVDFSFAETVANQLEVETRLIGTQLTRGSFEEALALADYAVENRLEAPRALEVAEGLYRLCASYDTEDPAPRLGLANCFEAGFRFEEAFNEYSALLEPFGHRAEVHVRLARLEARFLMEEQAEARLREALSIDSASWEAKWALGGFLAGKGEFVEAIELLQQANRAAPNDPELIDVRVAIRNELADALYGSGELAEANRVYGQALSAQSSNQHAQAGQMTTALLLDSGAGAGSDNLGDGDGFELLLARGLLAMDAGDWVTARELFELAADGDPLRADRAYGALSYLAQVTGNPAEAFGYAEEALLRNPADPYALFQKGRLLGNQDDYEGARAALLGALEQELDFEDALVALGEMAFQLGRFTDAQRYLERALEINDVRAEVHALLGIDFLRLGSVPDARASFERARELDPVNPTAKCGLAWCTYLDGDVTEALVLLADVDEARRNEPEDDPWRLWSQEQITRVQDHSEKVEWRDNFNRKRLINGWLTREGTGPIVSMEDGAVKVEGVFDGPGTTQVYREYTASEFVSFEADVWIQSDSNVRAGVFVARERQRKRERDVIAEASVSRHKDGGCQVRFISQGQPEELTDMQQPLPTEQWVRLSITRSGESSATAMTLSMDGIPLIENRSLPSAGTATSPLLVGLFVEGEPGRTAKVKMENVAVIYRDRR